MYASLGQAINRPSQEANKEHLISPVPGDYWSEHLVLRFVVLAVLENGNLVISDKDRNVTSGQVCDLSSAYEITRKELEGLVKYSTIDGFVADVGRNRISINWAIEWKSNYGGRFRVRTGSNEEIKVEEIDIESFHKELDELCKKYKVSVTDLVVNKDSEEHGLVHLTIVS